MEMDKCSFCNVLLPLSRHGFLRPPAPLSWGSRRVSILTASLASFCSSPPNKWTVWTTSGEQEDSVISLKRARFFSQNFSSGSDPETLAGSLGALRIFTTLSLPGCRFLRPRPLLGTTASVSVDSAMSGPAKHLATSQRILQQPSGVLIPGSGMLSWQLEAEAVLVMT